MPHLAPPSDTWHEKIRLFGPTGLQVQLGRTITSGRETFDYHRPVAGDGESVLAGMLPSGSLLTVKFSFSSFGNPQGAVNFQTFHDGYAALSATENQWFSETESR